jgi:hypothetical protein
MGVIMKTLNEWTRGPAIFFLIAIMFMVVSFASAAEKVKNENAGDTPSGVAEAALENQGRVEPSVADFKGPPMNPGPGWYVKIHGKNAGTYKYFKNGHPENQSEWTYYGPNPPPYAS